MIFERSNCTQNVVVKTINKTGEMLLYKNGRTNTKKNKIKKITPKAKLTAYSTKKIKKKTRN